MAATQTPLRPGRTAVASPSPAGTMPVEEESAAQPRGRWRLFTGRRRRLKLVAAAVAAALVGGGLYAALSSSAGTGGAALTGRGDSPAPGFTLPDLTALGHSTGLAQLRGHDVVLNFWASWCFPCRTEMPVLQAAQKAHPGVRFVGIDTNDTRAAALQFLRHVHVGYLTLYDPHGTAATAYGLLGLPTTVFVSAQGKVLGRHAGQLDAGTLAAALGEAFGPGA